MGRGTGITIELPSGGTVTTNATYRYVLAIDAGPGSWIEKRAHNEGPIRTRVRAATMNLINRAYVYDMQTGKLYQAAGYL